MSNRSPDQRKNAIMLQAVATIKNDTLFYSQDGGDQRIMVGSSEWFAWLTTATSFHFRSEHGTFTARRERASNRRGGWYWKAYYTQDGKRCRVYLGKAEDLTLDQLKAVSQTFAQSTLTVATSTTAPAMTSIAARVPSNLLLDTKLHVPRLRASLCTSLALDRAPSAGYGRYPSSCLSPGWLWQDHLACSVAG